MIALPAPSPTMLLTYKYRLNPEKRQRRALERITEQQRQLYNAALEERVLAWRMAGKSISEVEQSRSLTQIRADDEAFAGVQRRIQRATLKRLDRAYKAFFRRVKAGHRADAGFPKFKGREFFDGFSFDAFAQVRLVGNGLRFQGMPGNLRFWLDRPLPQVADPETGELATDIKNVWFKREGERWFVGFQVAVPTTPIRAKGKSIGVDWGTSVLAAFSTGEVVPNPRHAEAAAADVARLQRQVSRRKKGSKRRLKARRRLQTLHRKVANRRRNTMDKLSARLAKQFRLVATETIRAKDLMNAERPGEALPAALHRRRNREALDAAPFLLQHMIGYKTVRDGSYNFEVAPGRFKEPDGKVITIAPTQLCCMCGGYHYKELSEAEHVCTTPGPFYKMRLPRKVNAARVIEMLAFQAIEDLALAAEDRGGPVPGGAARAANADSSLRRLGNTEGEQSPTGRRSFVELLPHMHDPPPKPPPGRRRTAPS